MKVTTKKAAIEKQMAQLEKELKSIENSAAFKKENSVKRALANLMKKHSCSQSDLIALLQSDESEPSKRRKKPASTKRKPVKPLKLAVEIIKYLKLGKLSTSSTTLTTGWLRPRIKFWPNCELPAPFGLLFS